MASLGSGGEAQVFKARDRRHDRYVALKVRPVREEAVREELLSEARMLLALAPHPALPLVREDFFDGDSYVVAMDWVDGPSLAKLLAERGRPGLAPSIVLAWLAQAAEALTHLHTQGVIHGDVKPGNLILARGGRVKLVDFGLCSAPSMPRRRAGTPGYRAPELAVGASPSRASDVYALAATAFALLTGAAPAGILPSWEGVAPAQAEQLEAALRIGMATDPARRPKTAGELVERLRAGWTAALPTGVVTFCLSAIEGSAALWEQDPAAMAEALVRHHELIAGAVEARGGSFVRSIGDATCSVFDSAPAAVAAAFAAHRALAAQDWPLEVRFGLHTGEGADPVVRVAERVRDAAGGGEIFLSQATAEIVAGHLPEGGSLVDLGSLRALSGPGLRAPLAECPYRGLLAFQPEDRAFFFGREDVVAEVLSGLAPGRLLAVVGASGSGKSSLLRAGVMARVRAGEVPGLRAASLVAPGTLPSADAPDRLIVVDQFEELFTGGFDADRFIAALLGLRGAVAIGVRADFYGRLGAHRELARAVAGNHVLLGAMSASELEAAVREPARLTGLRLEPGLAELILRDVARSPGALPLLSHALRATWERRSGRTLTVAGYTASGGVASAIATTADAVLDALPPAQQRLARDVFVRMTELGEGTEDTRRRVPIEEFTSAGELLRRLADVRLVTLDDGVAEVAHEALIREWPRLRRWLDADRASLRVRRELERAARLWDAGGREPSDLYRGARLAAAIELSGFSTVERAFLDASRAASGRARRRLRALLAGVSLLALVALGAAVIARRAQSSAEAEALTADAERVGALAVNAPTLDQSLLLAVAAVQLQDRPETRGDLLTVLQRNPAAIRVLRQSAVNLPALAVSHSLLATGDQTGTVRFTAVPSWTPRGSLRLPLPVAPQAMAFAPDGRTLAVGTRQGDRSELYFVDVGERRARRAGAWRGDIDVPFPSMSLAFSPDGRRVAVALTAFRSGRPQRERLMMLDARSGRVLWRRRYPLRRDQREAHVVFGRDLVTSAESGSTLVWDARTGRVVRRYAVGGRPALSPDGRRIALTLDSPQSARVGVLDLSTGRFSRLTAGVPDGWLTSLGYTPDGARIAGTERAGTTYVWDVATGRIVDTYGRERAAAAPSLAIARRGIVLVASDDGSVGVWDPGRSPAVGRRLWTSAAENICPAGACTVVDSRFNAVSQADGTAALIDLRTGRLARTLPARDGSLATGLAFTPAGRVVTGGTAGSVTIRDPLTGAEVRRLRFAEPVWAVAVSPDGRLLAAQRWTPERPASTIEVRELSSGRTLYIRPLAHGTNGESLAFSPDGRALVAAGCCVGGAIVAAWDARTGALRFSTSAAEQAKRIAVAPDSRSLVLGTADGRVIVVDAGTGRALGSPIRATRGSVDGLAVSPDGRLLAVAGSNETTTLWDVHTHQRIGEGFPIPHDIPVIAFEPDGRLLIDNAEWPLDRPTLERFACRVAGRDLTRDEWSALLPNRAYRHVCPV